MSEKNYFEILGVSPEASSEDIKAAYRKRARLLHPDVNRSDGATAQMQELNTAYETLIDEDEREKYRQSILGYRRRDNSERTVTPDRRTARPAPVHTPPDHSRSQAMYEQWKKETQRRAEEYKERERLRSITNNLRVEIMRARGIADVLNALEKVSHEPLTATLRNSQSTDITVNIQTVISTVLQLQQEVIASRPNRLKVVSILMNIPTDWQLKARLLELTRMI